MPSCHERSQPSWLPCQPLAEEGQRVFLWGVLRRVCTELARPGCPSNTSSRFSLSDLGLHDRLVLSCFECSFCAHRERDDLMSALASVRSSLADVQQREASAYEQVKQAVQMTEEANFEKTKASLVTRLSERHAVIAVHPPAPAYFFTYSSITKRFSPNTQSEYRSVRVGFAKWNQFAIWRVLIPLQTLLL